MKYFRFRNWDKAQHYADRSPPWFRVYACILDLGNDWYELRDFECGQLVKLLAFASRTGNAMPFSAEIIAEEIHASEPVNLDKFARLGNPGIIEVLATKEDCVRLEQERMAARSHGASKDASKDASKLAIESAALRVRVRSEESEAETDQEQNPPTPRKRGGANPVRSGNPDPDLIAIIDHLNQVTGKRHSHDKGNAMIEGAIKRGATVAECKQVIDHLWSTWSPEWRQRIDKTTPFRPANFDRYLDEAGAGAASTAEQQDPEAAERSRKIREIVAKHTKQEAASA
jgi:uncharacterized phage protein (TIGR02220 family)